MTSGKTKLTLRKATTNDLDNIKRIAEQHRNELGFIFRSALEKSIQQNEILVAVHSRSLHGFVHYHHRRDKQTTLYHIAVDKPFYRQKIGLALLEALQEECENKGQSHILLKCPVELQANLFYSRFGFILAKVDDGNKRNLNVWELQCLT